MKKRIKEIIIGSIAVATAVMPINWTVLYYFFDKQPSLSYIAEFVIFVITLAVIEYIAAYLRRK